MFVNITTPKFAAQAIKKNAEIGWKPVHFLNNVSASIGAVMKPAGFEAGQGIISSAYLKDTSDPQWKDDAGMKAFDEFLTKYFPEGNRIDASVMFGYTVAQGIVHVLKQCGDNLTRENVMKQAANIKDLELGGLLPGIKVNTSPTDFAPISQVQLMQVQGRNLGTVRRNPERRRHQLTPDGSPHQARSGLTQRPPQHAAGVFFCAERMDNRRRMSSTQLP